MKINQQRTAICSLNQPLKREKELFSVSI